MRRFVKKHEDIAKYCVEKGADRELVNTKIFYKTLTLVWVIALVSWKETIVGPFPLCRRAASLEGGVSQAEKEKPILVKLNEGFIGEGGQTIFLCLDFGMGRFI